MKWNFGVKPSRTDALAAAWKKSLTRWRIGRTPLHEAWPLAYGSRLAVELSGGMKARDLVRQLETIANKLRQPLDRVWIGSMKPDGLGDGSIRPILEVMVDDGELRDLPVPLSIFREPSQPGRAPIGRYWDGTGPAEWMTRSGGRVCSGVVVGADLPVIQNAVRTLALAIPMFTPAAMVVVSGPDGPWWPELAEAAASHVSWDDTSLLTQLEQLLIVRGRSMPTPSAYVAPRDATTPDVVVVIEDASTCFYRLGFEACNRLAQLLSKLECLGVGIIAQTRGLSMSDFGSSDLLRAVLTRHHNVLVMGEPLDDHVGEVAWELWRPRVPGMELPPTTARMAGTCPLPFQLGTFATYDNDDFSETAALKRFAQTQLPEHEREAFLGAKLSCRRATSVGRTIGTGAE